ncbi:MAG TPA: TrkA C-terminal domain-containing protein, partial [Anaerolineales bacterium]
MTALFSDKMLVLFAILAIGSWIGQLSFKGITLGTAGVLFTALVFGHFGMTVPKEVMDLGLLLFVYAVGLQAGPRFFRTFRRHGFQFVVIALVTVTTGVLVTVLVALFLRLPYQLATGLYTGALTSTPALASAIDLVERIAPGQSANVSVGYGISYPYSMIGLVLLVQFLPRLLHRDVGREESSWLREKQVEEPGLLAKQFKITNPNCVGKRVSEINPHRMSLANISRVKRGDRVFAATPDIVLQQNDVVMVVGTEDELDKMCFILGEETCEPMDVNTNVVAVDVEVTESSLTGKKLAQMKVWEQYTVVITRIRRQGLEIAPTGNISLELGDNIRVVGERAAAERFVRLVHGQARKADETNMVPFLIGLLLGIALGVIPITLPNGITFRLGTAGGAFLVSVLGGHFGHIGPFRMYVPSAAKNLSRELGLMLFLAGAGVNAGAHFIQILQQYGPSLLLGGALITTLSVLAGILLMHFGYKMNVLSTMGSLCACMTNPPGLAAANT